MSDAVEPNLELARWMYGVWNTEALETWVDRVCSPEIVFHEAPEFPDTAVFRGGEALAAHLRELIEGAGHYQFEVRSLEGRGEFVLSTLEVSMEGPSSGAGASTPFFHVMRWDGDRLIELRSYLHADEARREYERVSSA